ncbi:hypothetical protein [uncultured Tateyamaria sp.]|uniref:hypothetical protein n=1 Tax=uncultured Tateyamaria sp. TaxID=455651 RepID=UPI00262B105B|nr:hypothetical protein [uncultured Tateyamaria sp.]
MWTVSSVYGFEQSFSQVSIAGGHIEESAASPVGVVENLREIFVKHPPIKTGFFAFIANENTIQQTNLRLSVVEVEDRSGPREFHARPPHPLVQDGEVDW